MNTATPAIATATAAAHKPAKALTQFEFWGRMLVLPYLLVFVVFVLYPVCYGDRKSVV